MPTPAATLASVSATGDIVSGPGWPTHLKMALPVSCMGDLVAGTVCTGAIAGTLHPTYLIGGRPVASIGCPITGVNPVTGIPVATAIGVSMAVTKIV